MKTRELTPFGREVKKALVDYDMTQVQLAARVGTSPQYLCYILYGVRPGGKYIPAIIAVLGLAPDTAGERIA